MHLAMHLIENFKFEDTKDIMIKGD